MDGTFKIFISDVSRTQDGYPCRIYLTQNYMGDEYIKIILIWNHWQRCFLPSFGSFGLMVSEEKNLKNQPIRNKSRLWWPCLLMDQDEMSNLYRGPSIDASCQMNWNLGGSIYGRSSINISHFVPIHLQTWPPQAILVSDWPIFKNLLLCLNKKNFLVNLL
jgi:hypothetical protein